MITISTTRHGQYQIDVDLTIRNTMLTYRHPKLLDNRATAYRVMKTAIKKIVDEWTAAGVQKFLRTVNSMPLDTGPPDGEGS